MELFTSFDGRISRKSYWLGILGIVVVSFVIIFLLGTILGLGGAVPHFLPLLISLILLYPATAITIKRLHDRNKAAMPWIVIFFGPGLLSSVMQGLQIDYTVLDVGQMMGDNSMRGMFGMGGTEILIPGSIAIAVSVLSLVVGIWALVELGFLKGTSGENSYGPDPLA